MNIEHLHKQDTLPGVSADVMSSSREKYETGKKQKKGGFKKGMGNTKGKINSKRITVMPNGEYKGKRHVEGLNIYIHIS